MADTNTGVKICQSCGMPMKKHEHHGTQKGGKKCKKFCYVCYEHGRFTDPDITLDKMVDKVACVIKTQMNMPEAQAKEMAKVTIPNLERWKSAR